MNGWCGGCPREHWRIQHGSDGKKEKENENEKEKEKPSFIIGGSPELDKRCRSLFVYTTVLLHDEWPIDSFSSSSSSTSSSSSGGETVGHCWTLLDTARCFSSVLRSISNRVIRSIPIKLAGQFCILPSVSNLINVRKEKKTPQASAQNRKASRRIDKWCSISSTNPSSNEHQLLRSLVIIIFDR